MSRKPAGAPPLCGEPLAAPRLVWQGDQPRALDFDDIYHAPDGAAETQRVFMGPANMPARWQQARRFTVAELGFGTGLNLATLLQSWARQPGGRLQYVTVEKHPLSLEQWREVCGRRQGALPAYADLAACYPPTVSGWHHRLLADGRISLHFYFGDAADALDELEQQGFREVDAWWLDGFAPDQNPALWAPALLARLPGLSGHAATVTTFTAAGRVRRALADAGFEMRRIDQRPHKRETLAGILIKHQPLPLPPEVAEARARAREHGIQIVGAGIAGASLARALADCGQPSELFEAGAAPTGASTLPAAVTHSRLLADGTPAAAVRLAAQLHSDAWLQRWPGWATGGVLQLAADEAALAKQQRLARRYGATGDWLTALEPAAARALWTVTGRAQRDELDCLGALWLRYAGALHGPTLLRWLIDAPAIRCRWQQPLRDSVPFAGVRVDTSGMGILALARARYLELAPLGGQLEQLQDRALAPALPLVGSTYRVPIPGAARENEFLLGASYEYRPWSPAAASAHNRRQLPPGAADGRAARGTRVVSSDRLPVAGMLYSDPDTPSAGHWVSGGHGSHGFTSAPLCAAVLAAQLTGTPPVVSVAVAGSVSPRRFRARQARRGYRFGASS